MSNPLAGPPPEGGQQKTYFGKMRLVTNSVDLVKGAAYAEAGLTDRDGNPYEFRGKLKKDDGAGQHTHVIVVIQAKNRDGADYNAFRDFMYWGSDKCQQTTMPNLRQHFGEKLDGIFGKSAWVQAGITEIEDGDYTRQAFVVNEVYKTRQEMETASVTHFSQYNQTPQQIADDIPGFDEPEEPAGMSKEQATEVLPALFAASGSNYDAFVELVKKTPVVFGAFGNDIDAEEILKYASPF
jgi:hypothetical protein